MRSSFGPVRLYATRVRLRGIAALAREAADLLGQKHALEQHPRAVTADLAGDERALRQSTETLAQMLHREALTPPAINGTSTPTIGN